VKNVLYFLITAAGIMLGGCSAGGFTNYITKDKDKLMDGDRELRFVSFNVPNLHYIEDNLVFENANPWRLPSEYEIRDALNAVKQSGGKVVRIYVLSVRKQGESKNIIRHVEAPGVFNEDAFKALDKVMQIAGETGIRVIIPFVDNWWWWGGPAEYAAFRGKDKQLFWTDPELISDFKKTVEHLVNRRNTCTGVLYKEDKAVLGWETGNELEVPFTWTADIAAYIKSLDKNHLVIEGTNAKIITAEALKDTNIDVLSTHHYSRADESVKFIKMNKELSKNKKPYIVGEFGLVPPQDVKEILDSSMDEGVSGIMAWSLRFHNQDGGFYMHRENTGSGPYRFPGFTSGDVYNETEIMNYIRKKAFQIDGKDVPPLAIPEPPLIKEIKDVYSISWLGSTGAESYIIERKEKGNHNWAIISGDITDADAAYKPLFADTTVETGKEYFYRIYSKNKSGISPASEISGPVKVTTLKLIDELSDLSKILRTEGKTELLKFEDIYRAKEDNSRLLADSGAAVIYKVEDGINSFTAFLFSDTSGVSGIKIMASADDITYTPLISKIESYPPYRNEYKLFTTVKYICEEFPAKTKYIKVAFEKSFQLGRTEIIFNPKIE
jgi:hypothetical protein